MIKIKKVKNVKETMITGSQEGNMKQILKIINDNIDNFSYDGDIEQFKVLKSNLDNLYGIYAIQNEKNDIIAFYQVLPKNNDTKILNLLYVAPEGRGNKLSEKFVEYMKRHLGCSKILLGDRFSPDMFNLVKNLSKRFTVNWENEKEGLVEPYKEETIDNFVSLMGPTGWQIILENSFDKTIYPRFYGENGNFAGSFYSCLFNDD